MKKYFSVIRIYILIFLIGFVWSCDKVKKNNLKEEVSTKAVSAKDILGNSDYLAMSYGGYRHADHSIEPTLDELREDMKLLSAMGVKLIRTYKLLKPQAANLVKVISDMKKEDPDFEMYVMLGAWVDCKNSFNSGDGEPDHDLENEENPAEIQRAVELANKYPDIIKIIAVGNEAMVKWATSYYVQPGVILKWVNHLQALKKEDKLPKDLWITSSDNFASWGGGGDEYHVDDLNQLIKAVDFISMHTYPMHDTHYNPNFWGIPDEEAGLSDIEKIDNAMMRSKKYAMQQYMQVYEYMKSLGVDKPIHIGETGWSSFSNGHFGSDGSRSNDEYKKALYYKHMRDWTNEARMSCFYFEAFDEPWKGGENPGDSEKHFGLFTVDGKAKYAIWDLVDKGLFEGLTRNGNPITKTYNGDKVALMKDAMVPPLASEIKAPH